MATLEWSADKVLFLGPFHLSLLGGGGAPLIKYISAAVFTGYVQP